MSLHRITIYWQCNVLMLKYGKITYSQPCAVGVKTTKFKWFIPKKSATSTENVCYIFVRLTKSLNTNAIYWGLNSGVWLNWQVAYMQYWRSTHATELKFEKVYILGVTHPKVVRPTTWLKQSESSQTESSPELLLGTHRRLFSLLMIDM